MELAQKLVNPKRMWFTANNMNGGKCRINLAWLLTQNWSLIIAQREQLNDLNVKINCICYVTNEKKQRQFEK